MVIEISAVFCLIFIINELFAYLYTVNDAYDRGKSEIYCMVIVYKL